MFLYLACTPDKYELPLFVADSAEEMAEYLGVPVNTVYKMTSRKRRQDRDGRKYKASKLQLMRISTEEDDPLCAMCGKPFVRYQRQQIYCSPTCRKAMAYRIIKEKEGEDL